jgi:hypothetical protein
VKRSYQSALPSSAVSFRRSGQANASPVAVAADGSQVVALIPQGWQWGTDSHGNPVPTDSYGTTLPLPDGAVSWGWAAPGQAGYNSSVLSGNAGITTAQPAGSSPTTTMTGGSSTTGSSPSTPSSTSAPTSVTTPMPPVSVPAATGSSSTTLILIGLAALVVGYVVATSGKKTRRNPSRWRRHRRF